MANDDNVRFSAPSADRAASLTVTPQSTGLPVQPSARGVRPFVPPTRSLDEARALARQRFKEKVANGEKVGGCDCHAEGDPEAVPAGDGPAGRVAGVRFRDSGRTYYFDAGGAELESGDWVVVGTSRGREAGRVVIAPHHVRLNTLEGDLRPIERRLSEAEVAKMDALRREASTAVRTFGAKIRERRLRMKPISAVYAFDGSHLTLNYSAQERPDTAELIRDLNKTFRCKVELKAVGPRDEARLLGGLGRCGRTLCCSSWLPVYPEISMGMAKTQDLALNPSKVSGVCGRLLCCLSYENEQYRQLKAVLPRLGQAIETPAGAGMVVSLQVVRELVTVRLAADGQEIVFSGADLALAPPPSPARPEPVGIFAPSPAPAGPVEHGPGPRAADAPVGHGNEELPVRPGEAADQAQAPVSAPKRRRRRRRRPTDGAATGEA